jgi:hypothetical protein
MMRFLTGSELKTYSDIIKNNSWGKASVSNPMGSLAPHVTEEKSEGNIKGWVRNGGESYQTAQEISDTLPPGVYTLELSDGKKFFTPQKFPSDSPVSLPGLPSDYILDQIKEFWSKENLYKKYKFIHKRGILMYGPPGTGKTCIIRLLCDEIISAGGVVFTVTDFYTAARCISHFRTYETTRPIMTVMEDVEGIFEGESGNSQIQYALSFLDGQDQVDNIVHVATTNQPESLADRFIKRPGRFDLVIGIHAPTSETREAYLRHVCDNQISEEILKEIVVKTEGLALSYLRELTSTYLCLGIPLDVTLLRLKADFAKKLKNKGKTNVGFTIGYDGDN